MVALFTFYLYRVNENLLRLSNLQFVIANRPRLIVRCVSVSDDKKAINYEIANTGDTGAEVIAIHQNVIIFNSADYSAGLLPYWPFTNERNINNLFIHAGQYKPRTKCIIEDGIGEIDWVFTTNNLGANIGEYCIIFGGYIVYKDDTIKITHRTAFYRIYDNKKARFIPIDPTDFDFEHEDWYQVIALQCTIYKIIPNYLN